MARIIRRNKVRRVPKNCNFCNEKKEPNFKEIPVLENYLSERGKILGKTKTGVCMKHQKRLAREIKRARFLALLPFVPSVG